VLHGAYGGECVDGWREGEATMIMREGRRSVCCIREKRIEEETRT